MSLVKSFSPDNVTNFETEHLYIIFMNKIYNIRGITTARDYDMDCNLVFYRIDDGEGWIEYETAIWSDDVSDCWTPATMNRTNLLWTVVGENAEKFNKIICKISGGASCEVEQN